MGIAELERGGAAESKTVDGQGPLRIVIAGGSSGIGARLAQALASEGHRIFICARRADRLASVADHFPGIETFVCDVSDDRLVQNFVAALAAKTEAVDVLINCAGGFGEIGSITVADSNRWWRTIEVNLKGTYLITQSMLPLLMKGNQPRVINFAGGGAFSPFPNFSAYACSKTAIVRLTECLAAELAPSNIRVNAIAPGFIDVGMSKGMPDEVTQNFIKQIPLGRLGDVSEIVNAALFLASPMASYITGHVLNVNGGFYMG
jgi:3-oxoacyl-[acyl-carrier protein] reductase